MYDSDYGPYRKDPRDPRYDDSEDKARDDWEWEESYLTKIGSEAIEEILWDLQTGNRDRAYADLQRAVDNAWEEQRKKYTQEHDDEHDL